MEGKIITLESLVTTLRESIEEHSALLKEGDIFLPNYGVKS